MSFPTIQFQNSSQGTAFSVETRKHRIAVEEWARHPVRNPIKRTANVAPLLVLVEDRRATIIDDGFALLVVPEEIARLDRLTRLSLGLPDHPPASLHISSRGTVVESDFEIHLQFRMANGLPFHSYQRNGAFLKLGRNEYTIDLQTYRALVAFEDWKKSPGTTPAERLHAFSQLKLAFPEGASLGSRYLDELRIEFAPAFKLRVFRNERGEADFDLEPCRFDRDEREFDELGEAKRVPSSFLDTDSLNFFSAQVRGRNQLLPAHTLKNGTILVFGKEAYRAMQIAHRIQKEPPEARASFLREPHRYLREAFGDENEERVDAVFWEDDLSDRIREIGVWTPPVLPWLKPGPTEWLPPESMGLKIGDGRDIEVPPERLEDLAETLERALENGETSVLWEDQEIPATQESLEAVRQLIERNKPKDRPDRPADTEIAENGPPRILLTHMNHEDLEYRASLRRSMDSDPGVPLPLQTDLLRHQEDALQWLQMHFLTGSPGAILADDMGLGKTLTALSFLCWVRELELRQQMPSRPTLLIAPTGLLSNWIEEHDKHLQWPGLGGRLLATGAGLRELRIAQGQDDPEKPVLDTKKLESNAWVLTTYETLRDYQPSFARVEWGVIVLDEAQKVKNPAARATNAINSLKGLFRLVMTGTPVENRLADLWSIADVAWPGRLGSLREFSQSYDQAGPDKLQALSKELMDTPPTFMKRRMKTDHISGLPNKYFRQIRTNMPPIQSEKYSDAVRQARQSSERGKMLGALQAFRRISLAPLKWLDAGSDEAWINSSARLISLFRILDEVREKREKALVFLEEKEVQADLVGVLQRRYELRRPPTVINGDVTGSKRQERVGIFQEDIDFDVMLISPKAGGVGLTLTAANHVIHLSRWWNPAVEDQCSDRVYRIGQTRDVYIHHPIAIHSELQDRSFDVLLDALLQRKRKLSQHVLSPAAMFQERDGEELFRQATQQG